MIGHLLTIFRQPLIKPVNYMQLYQLKWKSQLSICGERQKKYFKYIFGCFVIFDQVSASISNSVDFISKFRQYIWFSMTFYDLVWQRCRCQKASDLSLFITSYSTFENNVDFKCQCHFPLWLGDMSKNILSIIALKISWYPIISST